MVWLSSDAGLRLSQGRVGHEKSPCSGKADLSLFSTQKPFRRGSFPAGFSRASGEPRVLVVKRSSTGIEAIWSQIGSIPRWEMRWLHRYHCRGAAGAWPEGSFLKRILGNDFQSLPINWKTTPNKVGIRGTIAGLNLRLISCVGLERACQKGGCTGTIFSL